MSSEDEDFDLNYGIEDEVGKSFGKNTPNDRDDECGSLNFDQNDDETFNNYREETTIPRFEQNPKLRKSSKPKNEDETKEENIEELLNLMSDDENNEKLQLSISSDPGDGNMEELLNLIGAEDGDEDDSKKQENERAKIVIRKESNKTITQKTPETINNNQSQECRKTSSSIKITKIPQEEKLFVEKNTGIRLNKTSFKNESEMHMQLISSYGKFFKLTELAKRMYELKDKGSSFEWFSIFVLASKSDTKSSAKGNSYCVWTLCDLNNLERQQEISLFLFGNAYKTHWKSAEFEVFALVKPEFLDNKKANNKPNFNNQKPSNTGSWNKFASKNISTTEKLTMSINNDLQLVRLGNAKDITHCQSFTKINGSNNKDKEYTSKDSSARCKNLVNLEQGPFCVYHCVQIDKNKNGNNKNKYSMNKPTSALNRFGQTHLFESSKTSFSATNPASDFKFVPNTDIISHRINSPSLNKLAQLETKTKVAKEIKSEILLSLTTSIGQQALVNSPILSNVAFKTNKKSDKELMALLDGKELAKEEIKQIRIAEQTSSVKYTTSTVQDEASKEMKRLFNSKVLLPNESNCNQTISSKKLVELKKANENHVPGGQDYSSKLKDQYEKNKKLYNLSSMQSHRDIVKEMKKLKDDLKDLPEIEPTDTNIKPIETSKNEDTVIAKDFLKKHIDEIKRFTGNSKSPVAKSINQSKVLSANTPNNKSTPCGFDLELYIGDKLTTKKLLDPNSKYVPFSPATATSQSYKRKIDEITGKKEDAIEEVEDKKAKKLKQIDDILNIKSTHAKDASNPDKNPQLRAYYDKMEQQEAAEERLCNLRNREVRVVTCNTCDYTAFSQSEFCKLKRHNISRRMVLQRFFKCKSCKNRTYTLDLVVPVKACKHCGNEKFEPSTMKEQDISILSKDNSSLNQDSEYLIDL